MTSWRRWSERSRAALLVVAVLAVGLFAQSQSTGFAEPSVWLPDLMVGVTLAMVGVALMRDVGRVGSLVVLAGAAWFTGNFAGDSTDWIAWSSRHLELSHRAILFSALVTFPLGSIRDRVERVVIVAAFVGVLVPALARDELWMIAWASGLLASFVLLVHRRTALLRAGGYHVLPVMAVFWVVLVATASMLLSFGDSPAPRATVLMYQVGVVVTGVFLLNRASQWRRRTVEVADAVVEITFGPGSNVRDLLSEALRDPSVEVVFAIDRGDAVSWVDEIGRPAPRLSTGERSVVPIVVDGRPVAEVASVVDFEKLPTLLAAVASATQLAADHARLRSDLRREIGLVAESRRRLLTAADRERAELAGQLEREAGRTLRLIRDVLERMGNDRDHAVDEAARRSIERLEGLERDLDSLASGLGPTALLQGGLEAALGQLADNGDVAVTLVTNGPIDAVPSAAASTIYFACAEAIANAVKHATATRVCVTLELTAGCWILQVVDDGCGGASMLNGSGLQRLVDRIGALGGEMHLESPVGSGTRLTVELPCG